MGLLSNFIEAWVAYPTADNIGLSIRWTTPSIAAGGASFDPTGGRRGNPCLSINSGSNISKTLKHSSTWIFGIAYKTANLDRSGAGPVTLLNNNQRLFQLNVNPDGTLTLTGANQTQIIGTTATPFVSTDTWIFLECVVTFSGTTNILTSASLYINGDYSAPAITGSVSTSINMVNLLSNSATTNVVALSSGMVSPGGGIIDGSFYIHDGSGAIPGVWGDGKILRILPNGDTAQADWTPNSGSTHYNRVYELPKDDDTTYLSSATVGNKDAWNWEDIPAFSGLIRLVQVSLAGKKDDEGSKAFRIGVGATLSEDNSTDYYVNDTYLYYHYGWDLDPATALAWTRAGFNAKQFGPELRA